MVGGPIIYCRIDCHLWSVFASHGRISTFAWHITWHGMGKKLSDVNASSYEYEMSKNLINMPHNRNVEILHQVFMDTLVLTPQQESRFRALFLKCDRRGLGILDGDTARRLFRTSGLDDVTLYEIWNLADSNDSGELDYKAFCLCCVLIAYCKMYPELIVDHNWLWDPQLFDHLFSSGVIADCIPVFDTSVLEANDMGDIYAVTSMDLATYEKTFLSLDHNGDGYLEGYDVKDYYSVRKGLPDSELFEIWGLSDVDKDGKLSFEEFIIMEHLTSVRQAFDVPIPATLPPELERIVTRESILDTATKLETHDEVSYVAAIDMSHTSSMGGSKGEQEINKTGTDKRNIDGMESTHIKSARSVTSSKVDDVMPSIADNLPSSNTGLIQENEYLRQHIESLKSHIEELERDMERMETENAYLKSVSNMKEEHVSQLYAMQKGCSSEVAKELAKLRMEERELGELQNRIRAMQREKMRLEEEKQSLRGAIRHSEDASMTIMRSLRKEQTKVSSIKNDRIRTMRKKIDLMESMRLQRVDSNERLPKEAGPIDESRLHDSKGIRVATAIQDGNMERRLNPRTSNYKQSYSQHPSGYTGDESHNYCGSNHGINSAAESLNKKDPPHKGNGNAHNSVYNNRSIPATPKVNQMPVERGSRHPLNIHVSEEGT